MSSVLRISEAASLGLHAMAILAKDSEGRVSNRQFAEALNASEHHIAKVLARLAKAGLVDSTRGPGGGFVLARRPKDVTLLDVYEAVEGRLNPDLCLIDPPICKGGQCILGGLIRSVTEQFKEYLSGTTLADLAGRVMLPAEV